MQDPGEMRRGNANACPLHVIARRQASAFSRRDSPELCCIHHPLGNQRAQGRPGGRCTRGTRAKRIAQRRESTGPGGDHTGLPCAVVYGLYALFPVNLALSPSPPRCVGIVGLLGTCMGVPEPHDFAVRDQRRSSVSAITSTAFRSTFVTTRTPLVSVRNEAS